MRWEHVVHKLFLLDDNFSPEAQSDPTTDLVREGFHLPIEVDKSTFNVLDDVLLERGVHDHLVDFIVLLGRRAIILSPWLPPLVLLAEGIYFVLLCLLCSIPPILDGLCLLFFSSLDFVHEPFGFDCGLFEGVTILEG